MNIGKMRHPVTIQKRELVQDEYGEMFESWQDLAKAWASIDTVSGNEFIAASGPNALTTHRITMHYRGDLDPTMRIVSGGVNYKITALLPNNDRSILVVMCEVLV